MRYSVWSLSFLLVAVAGSCALAKEPVASGPQVGERPGPYSFLVASGPERGQQTCYVCDTADKPAVIVFARSLSEPLGKLLAACDEEVSRRPKDAMRAWMTVLGEKAGGLDDLGRWAKQQGLKDVPVGVFDDPVGPPSYRLSREADVTVLVFVNRKVVVNAVFRAGELDDAAVKRLATQVAEVGAKK